MKRLSSLNGSNLNGLEAIGLDVAKDKIDVCLLVPDQQLSYRIKNDSQAISQFCKDLELKNVDKSVPVILESTGDYHLLLAMTMRDYGFNIKEINPIITNQRNRCSIRGTKTDTTDAKMLADIGKIKGSQLESFTRSNEIIRLRKKVSLLAGIEKVMQEMIAVIKSYEKCIKLVGGDEKMIEELKQEICRLTKKKDEIEKSIIEESISKEGERIVNIIDSITGISPLIAKISYAIFASNIFENKKKMLAYVGLDPRLRQSGLKAGSYKMSKRGNGFMRKKLYQAAFCAIQHSDYYKTIYEREKQKGKHHFVCVLTIAKKMVYTMWSLIKKNELYNQNYMN